MIYLTIKFQNDQRFILLTNFVLTKLKEYENEILYPLVPEQELVKIDSNGGGKTTYDKADPH